MKVRITRRIRWSMACGLAGVVLAWWQIRWGKDGDAEVLPRLAASVSRSGSPGIIDTPYGGEAHSLAMTDLVVRAKANEQLSPADIQSLLAFISSPKPGDLTDGEWEERVNGILNLLRRQTQDFKTQDAREDGASSLAESGSVSAVPGLTEVLLEMAEKNPSKVLRLYAMQHLSLWFADADGRRQTQDFKTLGRETQDFKTQDTREEGASSLAGSGARVGTNAAPGAGERKRIVELLEKLATREGEETAGCALLMLADIRRQTEKEVSSGQFQVSSGEDSAADGIDWERVDGVLASAGRRLIADGDAPPDVRISAIHAAVDRKDAAPLPELRKIAVDAGLVSTLRKVAIHALGQLGTAEDQTLLESLPQDDGNLSQAVGPARKALASRLGQ